MWEGWRAFRTSEFYHICTRKTLRRLMNNFSGKMHCCDRCVSGNPTPSHSRWISLIGRLLHCFDLCQKRREEVSHLAKIPNTKFKSLLSESVWSSLITLSYQSLEILSNTEIRGISPTLNRIFASFCYNFEHFYNVSKFQRYTRNTYERRNSKRITYNWPAKRLPL